MSFAREVCVNILLAVVACGVGFAVDCDSFAAVVGDFKKINLICAICGGDSAVTIFAAADSVCFTSCNRLYRAPAYGYVRTAGIIAASYACAPITAVCGNSAAAYGDVRTADVILIDAVAAAYACGIPTTGCGNRATAYGYV